MLNVKSYPVRLRWSSFGSFLVAIFKLGAALLSFSLFLAINALYTAIIGYCKYQSFKGLVDKNAGKAVSYYKKIGFLIAIASIIYIFYTFRLLINHQETEYNPIVGITIATVTFFEMGLSSWGIYKARKNKDLMQQAVKMLNLCSALIGLVLTQTALMSFAEQGDHVYANVASGLFFGSITTIVGLWMFFRKIPTHYTAKYQ